jgi:LysM repeat protein
MSKFRKVAMVLMALVMMISAMGLTAQPALASGCRSYHWVRYGETLAWIGRYYGVSWPNLASVNGIGRPYTIYPGQRLCIPTGGYYGGYYGGYPTYTGGYTSAVGLQRTWSFVIASVDPNTTVSIRTQNFPSNVEFRVKMGNNVNGHYQWRDLPPLDSGNGGTFSADFAIPAEFSGAYQLALRVIQYKKNGKTFTQDQVFYNVAGGHGGYPSPGPWYPPGPAPCYGHPPCWGVIPTIWISSVVRDNTVTITTRNWPAGVNFQVLMGPMGTRGLGGYNVGTLYSGSGGSLTATFSIPSQLWGSRQIAIRTQNWSTGYYSYNWFYNNTTY